MSPCPGVGLLVELAICRMHVEILLTFLSQEDSDLPTVSEVSKVQGGDIRYNFLYQTTLLVYNKSLRLTNFWDWLFNSFL